MAAAAEAPEAAAAESPQFEVPNLQAEVHNLEVEVLRVQPSLRYGAITEAAFWLPAAAIDMWQVTLTLTSTLT